MLPVGFDGKKRCFAHNANQALYAQYHDEEWGIPVYEDQLLFECLMLEGAQAGLNWETILKKRKGYKRAFNNFEVEHVAVMEDKRLDALCHDDSIIRNRRKIYAVRKNAEVFKLISEQNGSFANFLWDFVDGKPIINRWKDVSEVPQQSAISIKLSKVLKENGMLYIGPKIMYAYMQAVGMVWDHVQDCWCYAKYK